MSKAFGYEFVIISDVVQMLDTQTFQGGPWIHLATIQRGLKEYMAFRHMNSHKTYIELVNPQEPGLLQKIEEDSEWLDIAQFLKDAGILTIGMGSEMKLGRNMIPTVLHDKV